MEVTREACSGEVVHIWVMSLYCHRLATEMIALCSALTLEQAQVSRTNKNLELNIPAVAYVYCQPLPFQ